MHQTMFLRLRKNKAQSFLEYTAIIMLILSALVLFRRYITQGMAGRFKNIGDSFGQARQYDAEKTIECALNPLFSDQWYNQICYEKNCDCESVQRSQATCQNCIEIDCFAPECIPGG